MCDETTERELDAHLKAKGLSRRGFALGSSAAMMLGGLTTSAMAATKYAADELVESNVSVTTPDGSVDGVFVRPRKGSHPAVIFWPDIHGVRPAFFDMARMLARSGYSVLAVNPYYRTHQGQLFFDGMSIRDPGARELVTRHRAALSSDTVGIDALALTTWLDAQDGVATDVGIGAVGFCMTGSWTLRAAAAVPDRIKAPCSFHGGGLVTNRPDSPHLLADKIKGGVLIAIAENDHNRQPEAKDVLIASFKDAGVPAEIEVYDGAMHGWVVTDSRSYDAEKSDRALGRMLALFEAQLS
ncbi:MAG: dienelactone hydrolase family protein [Pseudomonadota bacterium]